MKLTGIHIDAFGQFRDAGFDQLGSPVVCLSGPNEVGKTTLFSFVGAMLYGIYPVDPASNPYAPYDGRHLQGRLAYTLADGSTGEIRRSLRSTPEAEWTQGDGLFRHPESIRNRTLPVVEHVSRRVFQNVYALSLTDLTDFDATTLEEIQDRLLGGLNARHVRSARVVADELAAEAAKLWRPDNRGRPRSRMLAEEKRALLTELRDARERVHAMRMLGARISAVERKRAHLVSRRRILRSQLESARIREGFEERERELARLREMSVGIKDFADVAEDPARQLDGYETKVRDLEDEIAALDAKRNRLLDEARDERQAEGIVASESLIRAKLVEFDEAREAQQESRALSEELQLLAAQFTRVRIRISHVDDSSEAADVDDVSRFAAIDEVEVERTARMIAWQAAEIQRLVTTRQTSQRRLWMSVLGAVIVGLVAAVGSFILSALATTGVVLILEATAVVLAVVGVAQYLRGRQVDVELSELELGRRQSLQSLEQLMPTVAVHRSLLREPESELVPPIRVATGLAREIMRIRRALATVENQLLSVEGSVLELASRFCGATVEGSISSGLQARELLSSRLRQASARLDRRRQRTDELAAVEDRADVCRSRHEELRHQAETLRLRLSDFGRGNVATGVERLQQARLAHRQAVILEAELASNPMNSSAGGGEKMDDEDTLDEPAQELHAERHSATAKGDPSGEYTKSVEVLEGALRDLEVANEALSGEAIEAKEELARLGVPRSLSEVEGQVEALDAEVQHVRRAHDRLKLLEGVVRLADEQFREKHQPDVIERTNRYLRLITDGRYRGVVLDDRTRKLSIIGASDSQLRPLGAATSQGTRDQVYLSLRLALADHMDAGKETLPIFLDEVFVTWDMERRHRAYEILTELSRNRQIFLLTCHRWFEEEALLHLGAQVVHVDRANSSATLHNTVAP